MNEKLLRAAIKMDWQQVVFNQGPTCFHLEIGSKFCGRAQRWAGHGVQHGFVSLATLLMRVESDERERRVKK